MNGRPIRVVELEGPPSALGAAHGQAHGPEIREYAADRLARSGIGTSLTRAELLELAEACLPAHRRYAPDLFAEMEALADAAGLSPAEALVVGGYTDFLDTVRAAAGTAGVEDACTAVVVPDARAGGSGFLAQTWDMHASATPHIVMLRLAPEGSPRALVFTTVGCLGQIGMNEAGVAIGINNLTAADGRIGVTWPFVVRKALQQERAADAIRCVMDADLAGGHSFLVFDRSGSGAVIEAMPTSRHVFELGDEPLVHTNHCLVPETVRVEGVRPAALQASSIDRLADAGRRLSGGPIAFEDLVALTRDERAICRFVEPPFDYESCGAAIMRPATGDFWACWGIPSRNEYEHFTVPGAER